MSRTDSSIKNLKAAMIGQFLGVLISLASRAVFLRCLNAEYLGLNGLFTNVLAVFSLVELGVGPAMNFLLYKPLAENDVLRIRALMAFYRRAYIAIGCAIALLGLLFTPFYTALMDEVPDIPNLTHVYWLFTANAAISYFFAYKRALIICEEKRYIATIYRYGFYFALNAAQIAALLITRSYMLYLSLQLLFTFLENFAISRKADRMHPYLRERGAPKLPREALAEIRKNIGAMLMHKIGGVVVTSTDNLLLSRFVGVAAVGLYSNYFLITDALDKIISQIFSSVTASVGNLNATSAPEDRAKLTRTFERMFFVNAWIYGFCACCLWVLFNPFIALWLGEELLFDRFTVLIIVINFYLTGMRKSALTFREATGAFYYDRYKPLLESLINLVASILLALRMGAAGVFLGTIFSTLTTCIWVEPYVLYRHVFHASGWGYALRFVGYSAINLAACSAAAYFAGLVRLANPWLGFLVKMLICLVVPNLLFLLCYCRTDSFRYALGLARRLGGRLLRRKGTPA